MSVDKIKEYCRRLGSHSEDRAVLKDTLYKLNKMEVTVDILQKTGIGKVVNKIKNRGGKTGDMAADLIKKWRHVVDREAEQEQVEDNNNNNNHGSHGHHGSSKTEVKRDSHRSHESSKSSKRETSSSHHRSDSKSSKERPSADAKQATAPSSKDAFAANSKKSTSSRSNKDADEAGKSSHKKSSDHHLKSHSSSSSNKKPEQKGESPAQSPQSTGSSSSSKDKRPAERTSADSDSKQAKASSSDAAKQSTSKKRKTPDDEAAADDGMNANFGSFEECLGSIDPKNLKKKKKFRSSSSPKMTVTSSTLNGSSSKPKGPRLPDLTDKKPAESTRSVLDVKPLARVEPKPQSQPQPQPQLQLLAQAAAPQAAKRPVALDEAAQFTSSRKDRTAIYSGRRNATLTSVPSLFDACIRVLMDNVDYLEETGGVPYTILKPVLERCTWQQLYQLEYHNPYLTEDSDPLWEVHCRKDFRNKTPQRGEESWKELYLRCHDEREEKLKSLTASISQSMREKQAPVRTTKLAYVDSIAKAPLNVQRAQLKNGTFIGNKAQPSQARRIASQAATSAAADAVRPPPAAAASRRPKLAPLMAKTLSFLKMRKSTGYGFASR